MRSRIVPSVPSSVAEPGGLGPRLVGAERELALDHREHPRRDPRVEPDPAGDAHDVALEVLAHGAHELG